MRRLSTIAFLPLFLMVMLSLAACGGQGGGELESSGGQEASDAFPMATTAPTPTSAPTEENSVFVALLDSIPDTPKTRGFVLISDFALAREIFDIRLPDAQADQEILEDYVQDILRFKKPNQGPGAPFISGLGGFAPQLLDMARYLAFDARNVDQSALAGQPSGMLEVVRGRFDPDATDRALNACPECPPPDMESRAGTSFYSWGEDLVNDLSKSFSPPAFDQLGRGGRIAVTEEYVFRTLETPGMESLIDTSKGQRSSLADVDDFRLAAEGLAQLGALDALISDETQDWAEFANNLAERNLSQRRIQSLFAKLAEYPLLRPYQVFASGKGADSTGRYLTLVLVHRDEESAKDNVELLEQRMRGAPSLARSERWADMIDDMEINAEGRVLLAKLRGNISNDWIAWVFRRDLLIPHE